MENDQEKATETNSERDSIKQQQLDNTFVRAVKLDASTTTKIRIKHVVNSVDVAVTKGPGVFGLVSPDLSRILDSPPENWPNDIPWKPRRYFGPFWEGSELSQIGIDVQGPSTAIWFYNDYFTTCPDAARYQPFYPGQNLPNLSGGALAAVPGYMPSVDGAGRFSCLLERIAYSSRYGGTVELTFRARYDVGLEVRYGEFAWDLKNLELRIYVAPTSYGLQTPAAAYSQGRVTCDILSSEQICYSVPTQGGISVQGVPFQALSDVHQAELIQALGLLSQELVRDISNDARRFVGGFLTALFPDLLGPGRIVNSIIISDDFIELNTRQAIPVVSVNFRARNVKSFAADPFTDPEFRLTLESWHAYLDRLEGGPIWVVEFENKEDTPWYTAGQWNLDNEIPRLDFVLLRVSGVEVDWPGFDDVFETFEFRMFLDHAELLAANNANQYGLIEERSIPAASEFQDSGWHIFFDLDVRVNLGVR